MEKNKFQKEKGSSFALFPIFVFIAVFMGSGIILNDFYKMPTLISFLLAAMVAVAMNGKAKISEKVDVFCKGAGEPNIILMCLIFLFAGAFAGIAEDMGGVKTTVNLALFFLPENLLLPGLFLVACFISLAMGTSMGTILALSPIGIGIANETGIALPLTLGTIVGGSMFGDNLSMISDTTIAAVRTQGCSMRDKFLMNFSIVIPAALISLLILFFQSGAESAVLLEYSNEAEHALFGENASEYIKVIPYLFVLGAALAGFNVILVLFGGIVLAGAIGIYTRAFDLLGFFQSANGGLMSMAELSLIALLVGGIISLIEYNGGIAFLLRSVRKKINSKKSAELGIASLVSLVDICTAYNTIAIVMTGPLAKDIAIEYEISPRRAASLMDIFSCCFQGILPYGAQMLAAAGAAKISPINILPYSYYPILLGISGFGAIALGIPRFRKTFIPASLKEGLYGAKR